MLQTMYKMKISNTTMKSRLSVFLRRKKTLAKKLEELSVICDIDAGMILFDPFKNSTEVCARNPDEFMRRCRNLSVEERLKNTESVIDVLNARKKKVESDLATLKRQNYLEAKYPSWDPDFDSFTEVQLIEVVGSLDAATQRVDTKLEEATKEKQLIVNAQPSAQYLCLPPPENYVPLDMPVVVTNQDTVLPDQLLVTDRFPENPGPLDVMQENTLIQANDYWWSPDQFMAEMNGSDLTNLTFESSESSDFWQMYQPMLYDPSTSNGPDYGPTQTIDQDHLWDIVLSI